MADVSLWRSAFCEFTLYSGNYHITLILPVEPLF